MCVFCGEGMWEDRAATAQLQAGLLIQQNALLNMQMQCVFARASVQNEDVQFVCECVCVCGPEPSHFSLSAS